MAVPVTKARPVPDCPHCGHALRLPGDGAFRCSACRRTFEFYTVLPLPAPRTGFEAAPPGSRCAEHEENAAVTLCERCGDFVCGLCRTPIEGRIYCPACFDLLCDRGAFRFSRSRFVEAQVAVNLAGMAYLGLLVPGLNVVLSGLAIVNAVTALKKIREKPDLPGKGQALSALALAGLNLALFLALVLWFLFTQLRQA